MRIFAQSFSQKPQSLVEAWYMYSPRAPKEAGLEETTAAEAISLSQQQLAREGGGVVGGQGGEE